MKRVNERGGAAALQGEVDDLRTTVATAGLRFDKGLKASFQQDSWLHLRGGVGYRHASGDRDPAYCFAFATGSDSFVVSGAPLADRTVVAELGLSAWLTTRQQLELGYSGQFGDESRDHSANLRWSVRLNHWFPQGNQEGPQAAFFVAGPGVVGPCTPTMAPHAVPDRP